jgi:hypothetical protein
MRHALDSNDVEMPVEEQAPPAGRAESRRDIWASGRCFRNLDSKAPCLENVGERARDLGFARSAGDE